MNENTITRHPDFIHVATAGTFGAGDDERAEWTTLRRVLRNVGVAATVEASELCAELDAAADRLTEGLDDILTNLSDDDGYPTCDYCGGDDVIVGAYQDFGMNYEPLQIPISYCNECGETSAR